MLSTKLYKNNFNPVNHLTLSNLVSTLEIQPYEEGILAFYYYIFLNLFSQISHNLQQT